jgi:hypothetical protein
VPEAVADAGPDRSVDRGSRVRLQARGVEGIPDEAIRWTQTFGPDVTGGSGVLTGPFIGFDAPLDVSSVVLSLEVVGADDSAATDEVLVRVFEDVTSAVFVDSESGIAQADGSMGAPYASIREALELAAGQDVYIRSVGRYDESEATVTLGAEVSMYGGFVEGWRRDVGQRTAIDVGPIGIAVTGSGERWLSALDLTVADALVGGVSVGVFVEDAEAVHVADSRIVGGAGGGGDVLLTGNVSVGVRAERVEVLIIERSTIHAGRGGAGSPPFPPGGADEASESGLDGGLPDGGSGAAVDDAMPGAEHRGGANGGDGGDGAGSDGESGDDSADASGGVGGSAGEEDEPDGQLAGSPGAGGGGGVGGGGGDGGGDGGLGTGTDATGSTGSTGGAAQPGGGGAGGGGGAVASADEPESDPEPEPEPLPESEEMLGGGGGGGGAGGVPGTPGAGGGGGGGSIGLWSIDVDRLIIVESVVAGGRGGDGADGAAGAAGQAASAGGNGAVPDADDDRLGVGGGAGGGGAGGTGGGGGGGAGGPSIGLLTSGVGTVEVVASTVLGGGGGAGAAGGLSGADGAAGAVGEATFGGLGGVGDRGGAETTARSSALAGVGAAGGASVGWLDTGGATLVGDESSFEAGAGGPGGAGFSPGATGASTDISG